jgi:hypothetical protein
MINGLVVTPAHFFCCYENGCLAWCGFEGVFWGGDGMFFMLYF